jgi:hypothetical protein
MITIAALAGSYRAMRIRLLALIATAALLALAASANAGGRNDLYSGPIDQTQPAGFPSKTSIELYVHTQRHHDGSSTVKITHVNIFDVTLRCENGNDIGAGNSRGDTDTVQAFGERYPIKVEAGSFDEPHAYGATGERVEIRGKLSKRSASGTLVISDDIGDAEGEEGTEHLGTCRSGTLSWTATRTG